MFANKRGAAGRHRIFLRLLVPNILFLLFPLFVGWIVHQKTLDVVENEVTAGNLNLLKQTSDTLSHRFAEIESIARQMANDTRIGQFQHVTAPFEGSNLYRVLDTRKSLYNYSLTNSFMFNYFIVFKNSRLVLTENGTYDLEEFRQTYHYDGMSSETWDRLFMYEYQDRKVLPAQDVTWNGNAHSLVTFVQSLGYPGYPQGTVAITVDNLDLRKLLGGHDLTGGGHAFIAAADGSIISSVTSEEATILKRIGPLSGTEGSVVRELNGQQMMVTYIKANSIGWTYFVVQPADVVLRKVNYIKNITFTMAIVFLLLGLSLAYLIAYRNSRPLRGIVDTIAERMSSEARVGKDAYRYIRETISGLIDTNHKLQMEMEKQLPMLQAALFERLLRGDFLSAKEIPSLLQQSGIGIYGENFASVIIEFAGYNGTMNEEEMTRLHERRIIAKDLLRQKWGGRIYLHDLAEYRIAVLLAFQDDMPEGSGPPLEQAIQSIYDIVTDGTRVPLKVAAGGIQTGLPQVARSYEEAKRTLDYMNWINVGGAMCSAMLPDAENGYHYPADAELRLMNLTKAGDREAVMSMLNELYAVNFEARRLSVSMLQLFIHDVWGTIAKLLPQVSMVKEIAIGRLYPRYTGDAVTYEGLKISFTSIMSTFRRICDYVSDHKKSQNVRLLEKILQALRESYSQPELCLDSVADKFNISRGYLSQFFKEQTGVNFSDYVEELRMSKAKEWLAQTDMPVHEIAARLGYSSSNTFCRAFKRIYGISTTQYRRSSAS